MQSSVILVLHPMHSVLSQAVSATSHCSPTQRQKSSKVPISWARCFLRSVSQPVLWGVLYQNYAGSELQSSSPKWKHQHCTTTTKKPKNWTRCESNARLSQVSITGPVDGVSMLVRAQGLHIGNHIRPSTVPGLWILEIVLPLNYTPLVLMVKRRML